MNIVYAMGIGFLLDLLLGDPHALPHPVRWIGALIACLDKRLRNSTSAQMIRGGLLVLCVLAVTGGAVCGIRFAAYRLSYMAGVAADGILFYYCIAPRSLCRESMAVLRALQDEGLEEARGRLSMIVGRDTGALTEEGVVREAVETGAENTSDGVTAPILYMALGGPVLCFLYKAVNTMDSMLGYHNDTYEYFGRAAAKMDDIWNYIPSRLTAWIMLAGVLGLSLAESCFDCRRAFEIYLRDRRKHKSPNSAQTESVCAGALGVRLAGDASYFGKTLHKPYIGDAEREIEREDIRRANRLMYMTAVLTLLLAAGLRAVCVATLV